ncbi:MAG: hypothetical protein KC419_23895, partial [Anaerolineales bacterium]|nr:hypothetical protein [Anaerolineales bacterium]
VALFRKEKHDLPLFSFWVVPFLNLMSMFWPGLFIHQFLLEKIVYRFSLPSLGSGLRSASRRDSAEARSAIGGNAIYT